MTVAIVTDSNAMLPAELVERFEILVVSLTVVIDGHAYREDRLDQAEFCARLRKGAKVTTSAPSPGEVLAVYEAALSGGATEILSIHIGSNQSATVSAAQIAAKQSALPVRVIDTGTASFIAGCCVWRSAELLADGASVDDAEAAAKSVAESASSVFTIGEIDRANASGRLPVTAGSGVPVYWSSGAEMSELGKATSIAEATSVMADLVGGQPGPQRVGVGHADAPEAATALLQRLSNLDNVVETIRYTVGPSVAAHTGVGTFGAVFSPMP